MSFKQCSGCQAMVSASKAYCPDCGAPMDEEQKRSGSSEFDSQVKTQNLNSTSQLRLLDEISLSTFFNLSANSAKGATAAGDKPENQSETIPPDEVENQPPPEQPKPVENQPGTGNQPGPFRFKSVDNLTKTILLTPQADARSYSKPTNNVTAAPAPLPVVEPPKTETHPAAVEHGGAPPDSKRKFYFAAAVIFAFFMLVAVFLIILGILYWYYWK